MHEMSLAQSIVELVCEAVPPAQRSAVRRVTVDVGRMAGVVGESLDFCFEVLVASTAICQAHLQRSTVPLVVACATCGVTSESDLDTFACPHCGSVDTRVISGMELRVRQIELAETTASET